jgi:hypothetical protein
MHANLFQTQFDRTSDRAFLNDSANPSKLGKLATYSSNRFYCSSRLFLPRRPMRREHLALTAMTGRPLAINLATLGEILCLFRLLVVCIIAQVILAGLRRVDC